MLEHINNFLKKTWCQMLLLLCICHTQRCNCNAWLTLDILCVIGHLYPNPHQILYTKIMILFIEFTYCSDHFTKKIPYHETSLPNINHSSITLLQEDGNTHCHNCKCKSYTHIPLMNELKNKKNQREKNNLKHM
jgi:hypothetical protein